MRRRSTFLLVLFVCLTMLSACGGGGGEDGSQLVAQAADTYPFDPMTRATIQSDEIGRWARQNGVGLSGRPDVNQYNYSYSGQVGPRIYTSLPPSDVNAGKYKTSNMYYLLGSGLTGLVHKDILLRKGHKLTVLIK